MSSLVAFNLGIQYYDFSTTANTVFLTSNIGGLGCSNGPLSMTIGEVVVLCIISPIVDILDTAASNSDDA